jgi:hypothetical protein
MESGHWQIPLRAAALLDLAIVFPVSTETIERNSLSDTAGTWTARKLENLNSKRSPTLPRSEARCRWSLNIVFPRRRLLPDQQPIRTA